MSVRCSLVGPSLFRVNDVQRNRRQPTKAMQILHEDRSRGRLRDAEVGEVGG